jgi:poly-gamma-glutamate capsule biosynthesis protein CapA/YwtB (metallophosphatase superfamily)
MQSRSERYRKNKKESKWPVKRLVAVTAASAAIVLVVVLGVIYLDGRSNPAQHKDMLTSSPSPSSMASAAPEASPLVKTSETPAASSSPTPDSTPVVPAQSEAPQVSQAPVSGAQVKMAFVGDVIFSNNVEDQLVKFGYDYPYTYVKDYLQKADLTLANLETPVTERGDVQKKEYVYRSSPLALPAFKEAGVDIVNLANNHVMDYGAEGLLDTMSALDRIGIQRVGVGKDAEEAYAPVIVEKQGIKIAILGYSRVVPEGSWKAAVGHPGVAETYNYTLPVKAIQKAKQQADLVVVIAHWGVEREDKPDQHQTELAHRYIDAGADLIVGSHPHVLQGFEIYKGKWIAYSLGNFIFTINENSKTWESAILQATCSKEKQCNLDLVPIQNTLARPEIMSSENGIKLFERLSRISFQSKVNTEGHVIPLQKTAR